MLVFYALIFYEIYMKLLYIYVFSNLAGKSINCIGQGLKQAYDTKLLGFVFNIAFRLSLATLHLKKNNHKVNHKKHI